MVNNSKDLKTPNLRRQLPLILAAVVVFAASVAVGLAFPMFGRDPVSASPDPGVPPPQNELLQGGLSQAEYKTAVGRTIACMNAQGVGTEMLPTNPDGTSGFRYGSAETLEALAADDAVYEECRTAHSIHVERAWAERPAAKSVAIDWGHRTMRCLEGELGIVFADDEASVRNQLHELRFTETYASCMASAGQSLLEESGSNSTSIWGAVTFTPLSR